MKHLSAIIGELLSAACAEQTFNRGVTDIQRWMDEAETQLASEELGKDVESVNNLQKRHQLLETDIIAHKVKAVLKT